MKAIDRKLWRDLWHLKGPAFAIAAVIASGAASFIMFLSTLDSLQLSRELYYRDYRFAAVFAPLKRAPETIARRLAAIPGVDKVDTRVVAPLTIEIDGFVEPVTGLVTSVPDHGEPSLNRLYLRTGRAVDASRDDEVVISEAFAEAHTLCPGDRLHVTILGKRKMLRIVGTGGSPEFIHQLQPGGVFPDFEHYGVLWMARGPLENAFDMAGAFNHVVLSLQKGAHSADVIDRIDALLKRYGGTGAYTRDDQLSHRFLAEEINQLDNLAGIFPFIFLGVAVFLLNVVVSRLVTTQREQVAALKAFGYGNSAIAVHYLKLILAIVLTGIVLGIVAGSWLGRVLSEVYVLFFRLPFLHFVLEPARVVQVSLITLAAGILGTLAAVRNAIRLRPAEAMRPEAPALYRQTLVERIGPRRGFSTLTRMILRHIGQKPVKSSLAVLGIALAFAILMTGRFQEDTVNFMMTLEFGLSQRDDLAVTFSEPTSITALTELKHLPGITHGEGFRAVAVRLRSGHRAYRTAIQGLAPAGDIRRLIDTELKVIHLPAAGLVLNDYLAREILRVQTGDTVTIEVLEGSQPVRQIPVVALVRQFLGVGAYMDLDALNRLLGEGPTINGALLSVDAAHAEYVYQRLKQMPRVAGTRIRHHELRSFHRMMDETMLFWTSVSTVFAIIIAVGVIYNSARITLTERSRELASMRVLGFTRGEISYVLLGELVVLTVLAILPGLWLGRALCGYIARTVQNDLYRIPLILEPATYAFAALVVLLAATVSALLVRRRLDRLDLIEVLKTKE